MMSTKKVRLWQLIVCVTTLMVAMTVTPVRSNDDGNRQDDNGEYEELTALWWKWLLAQPAKDVPSRIPNIMTNTNAVLDSTGEFAANLQADGIGPGNKYFFLVATLFGEATRTVTVPKGKSLFFPLINTDVDNATNPPTHYTVPKLRAIAKSNIDAVTNRFATLNGFPVQSSRLKSPVFSYKLPSQNSLYAYFGFMGPQFEGTVKLAVSDGYWAVVPPLPSGHYILEFGGADSNGLDVHVKYNLTVP